VQGVKPGTLEYGRPPGLRCGSAAQGPAQLSMSTTTIVGLSNRMAPEWLHEFQGACERLELRQRLIDIGNDNWMSQLDGVDVFVWRLTMGDPSMMAEARTKIPLIQSMGIRSFPDSLMLWLYEDKIRQTFFLRKHGYPTPYTAVFFTREAALDYLSKATYPLVTKSHTGAGGDGVNLLRSPREAERLLNAVFCKQSLWSKITEKYYYLPRTRKGNFLVARKFRYRDSCPRYAYFQEFIPGNSGDLRVATVGPDLVSAFWRRNRANDFRASGSGMWEAFSETTLPGGACDLALEISNRHGFTSMAYDFLQSARGWVIGEISYTFVLTREPWDYTDALFRKTATGWQKVERTPLGELHLSAIIGKLCLEGKPAPEEGPLC
jgi:glutathione synthase/RimK-type ligase-like ATP-grasp enzyme